MEKGTKYLVTFFFFFFQSRDRSGGALKFPLVMVLLWLVTFTYLPRYLTYLTYLSIISSIPPFQLPALLSYPSSRPPPFCII